MALDGKNISLPIYHDVNGVRTPFHNLVLHKFTVDSVVMSLGDKITGDVYYIDSSLDCSMKEYVVFNDVEYTLVNPPTLVREGLVKDNSDLNGMSKFSFEFYHPMYILGNLPFTDVAVSYDEMRYKSQDKTFSWIGKPADFVAKLNKNLENTEWVVVLSDRFPQDKEDELSEVLSFDNNTIADVLKTGYETWEVPFVVDKLHQGEYYHTDANNNNVDYYTQGKRFVVVFGLPSNEIYASATDEQQNIPFVFRFGQGVGLKNNSRTPRNNKIVTRIAGYGSENNIPYGYPQIRWYGDPNATCTIGDSVGAKQNVTINGTTYEWAMSYPIYDGIVGGEWVKLIKHPFTRNHLMPTIYVGKPYNENDDESDAIYYGGVFNKVSQFLPDGSANPNYNPNIEIKDYYDAVEGEQGYDYKNLINPVAPSYEIHEFDDIKPELGEAYILGATPVNADLTDADDWDDTMDDNGNYLQSYFKITLPQLTFDIYACAAITQEMEINMRSGACIGCTFTVQVDWEDYKRNFYDSDMNFAPNGQQRDYTRYPDSSQGSITVVVQKDINTFGTLMPNIYQNPHAGDAFVVLGISLPLSYITSAQERLDDAMKSYMLGNNVYYFDYPLKFDEYMLANNTNILNQIRPNSIIRFEFNDEPLELFVKQLTIKFNENTLPQYDITLTDNIEVVLNQIGQVAEDVEHLGTLIALLRQNYNKNAWAELAKKLSKVSDDTASGLISFAQGWETVGFFSNNFLGYGAKVNQRGVGEFEEINVRGALRASELVFNQIDAEEGESIRSIGHGEIETVTINQSNPNRGTATLKLDGDEWATISSGDICRGLYNTIIKEGYSGQDEGEDENGFRNKKGFFASYFRVIHVSSSKGMCSFTYQLQVENKSAGQTSLSSDTPIYEHPCPLMKFAVYGNIDNNKKERQSSIYTTAVGIAPRQLFLAGVNDWVIKPENIKLAKGNIEGIKAWEIVSENEYEDDSSGNWKTETRDGETIYMHLKTLHGDAGFYCEDNIYLGGIIDQFKSAALEVISSEISNLGQAYVWTDVSGFIVDCDSRGNVSSDTDISINAKLYFGNQICTLTEAKFNGVDAENIIDNGKNAVYSSTILQGTQNFTSYTITVSLKGTYNGVEYTSTKTINVFANKQGIQGDSGLGAAWIDVVPSAISIDCKEDGTISNTHFSNITAALYVGSSKITELTEKTAVYSDLSHYEPIIIGGNNNGGIVTWFVEFSDTSRALSQSTIDITLSNGTYTATKSIPIIPIRRGAQGDSIGGYSAQLTRSSDNIVVDSQGIFIGGLANRLYTEVNIWDSANNRALQFQDTNGTPSDGKFKLSIVESGCSASIDTTNGRISISNIENPTISNYCSITIVATTFDGVVFNFVYTVTLTHLNQSYLSFNLNNEYDSIAYRTQTKKYDGLPVSATMVVYANGVINEQNEVTYNNVQILSNPSIGYVKKTIATSSLFDGAIEAEPLITANSSGEIIAVTHRSYSGYIITDDNDQDTGLRFRINSGGTITLTRSNNSVADIDLADAKHWVDISLEVVYGGVTYISPTKRFTLVETTDSTIYRLILSATAISQEESVYTPDSIDVQASITNENGTQVIIPDSSNGLVLGSVYVKYINGIYSKNSTNVLLDTCPHPFSTLNGNVLTVVLVDLSDVENPIYLDIQTVTINKGGKDGAGQSWVNCSHDQFVVDCESNGTVSTTRYLDLTANLRWGDINCVITSATIDTSNVDNVTVNNTTGINTTQVAKRITFTGGNPLSSGYITITLSGKANGVGDTHTAQKTISIIANKKGNNGESGRGIVSVVTYYMRSYLYSGIISSQNEDPTQDGWFSTRIEPTEEEPYLWRFTRTTYSDEPITEQTNAELIYVWSDVVNPNLLENTDFLSDDDMNAWVSWWYRQNQSIKWSSSSIQGGVEYKSRITTDNNCTDFDFGVDNTNTNGYNSYKAQVTATSSLTSASYATILRQICYKYNVVERISANKWHTLSFLHKGDAISVYCNLLQDESVIYVDGIASDYNQVTTFEASNEWVRHSITFLSRNTFAISTDYVVEWRLPLVANIQKKAWICKPKLEVGNVATDYRPKRNVDEPIHRASTWVEGKQYYEGKRGEPFLDIVAKNNRWYRCQKTNVSTTSNAPSDGSTNSYWELSTNFDFIATDLLLADKAVIRLMFSQKILMTNEQNQLTASINADGNGSYCIYYPPTGNKMYEFSYTKDIVCYNDDDVNSVAWRIGQSGLIEKPQEPHWSKIWLCNLSLDPATAPSNNSFRGEQSFTLDWFWVYIAGDDSSTQSHNGKIYVQGHLPSDSLLNGYAANGWYTKYAMPAMIASDNGDMWEIEIIHIVNGIETQKKVITTTISGN